MPNSKQIQDVNLILLLLLVVILSLTQHFGIVSRVTQNHEKRLMGINNVSLLNRKLFLLHGLSILVQQDCRDLILVHLSQAYHFLFLLHHSTSVSFPVMSLHSFSFPSRVLPILDQIVSLYAPVEIAYRQPLAWVRALSLFASCQVGLIVLMYRLYRCNLIALCITPGYACYSVYQVMGPV